MLEGNFLRRQRQNVSISADGRLMMAELAHHEGLSGSGVIEQAIRRMYEDRFGKGSRPVKPEPMRRFAHE